jgi:hypothetical protein
VLMGSRKDRVEMPNFPKPLGTALSSIALEGTSESHYNAFEYIGRQ